MNVNVVTSHINSQLKTKNKMTAVGTAAVVVTGGENERH